MAAPGASSGVIAPPARLAVAPDQLETLCQARHITELALFGSVLREDFQDRSDVDMPATFAPGQAPGMEVIDLIDQLAALFGRPVDLTTRRQLERGSPTSLTQAVLSTAQVIYCA